MLPLRPLGGTGYVKSSSVAYIDIGFRNLESQCQVTVILRRGKDQQVSTCVAQLAFHAFIVIPITCKICSSPEATGLHQNIWPHILSKQVQLLRKNIIINTKEYILGRLIQKVQKYRSHINFSLLYSTLFSSLGNPQQHCSCF